MISRLAILLAIAIAFGVGYLTGNGYQLGDILTFDPAETASQSQPITTVQLEEGQPAEFAVFWEAWARVEENYFYPIPSEELRTQAAIEGMLTSLDDEFTRYTSPEAAALMRETDSGDFEGIGAYVDQAEEGGVLILRIFEDSPAAEAGLRDDDVIIAVDGRSIIDLDLDTSLVLVRGPSGSDVVLTIMRLDVEDPFDLTVTRRRIEVPTAEARMLEDDIGYVALFVFNEQSNRRLRSEVNQLLSQGAEAIILDLRDNPGGYLDQAISISDLFLPQGDVLSSANSEGQSRVYQSGNGDRAEDIPLVVLIQRQQRQRL